MRHAAAPLVLSLALLGLARSAEAITVLTHGKLVKLTARPDPARSRGLVRIGKDPALAQAPDPSCPTSTTFELGVFPSATERVVRSQRVVLDCARWTRKGRRWMYRDPEAAGGVKTITYGPAGLVVKLVGPAVLPAPGPVGYVQAWFEVGARRFHARFHTFKKNDASRIVGRKPSKRAAEGEAGFWAVILGDDPSEARQQATLQALDKAARRSRRDGRSPFLLGMLRLYRFGQMIDRPATADAAARAEIEAAMAAFERAEPLLWDRTTEVGDSRVPGFVAAAKYNLALVLGDGALEAEAVADLEYAVTINAFFNVFDLLVIVQAATPDSAEFQLAFRAVADYLEDPEVFTCLTDQPEICSTTGFAPGGMLGALTLFGDIYAKAGVRDDAVRWYSLAAVTEVGSGWRFEGLASERLATIDDRIAAYGDADPANDPLIVGAREEACSSCHNRFAP